jgi:hypothetical protein
VEKRPFMAVLARECELRALAPDLGAKARKSFPLLRGSEEPFFHKKRAGREEHCIGRTCATCARNPFGNENGPVRFGRPLNQQSKVMELGSPPAGRADSGSAVIVMVL